MRRYGESVQHEKAKEKVANVLRDNGFTVYIDSHPFECQTAKGPRTYWPDVYAENFSSVSYTRIDRGDGHILGGTAKGITVQSGGRRIIVEIQGKGGHNTKLAFNNDNLRLQDIRESHGRDIQFFELQLRNKKSPNDIRNWSDADILEELGINS